MEARINAALDEIRKVLAQDGGSIELVVQDARERE